jgi:hypothetical protein
MGPDPTGSSYVFRDLTDLSYPAIAREFGGREPQQGGHIVDGLGEPADRVKLTWRGPTEPRIGSEDVAS